MFKAVVDIDLGIYNMCNSKKILIMKNSFV